MDNLVENREGELGPVPFRSGRFYSIGNKWYFAVRDMPDQGPFGGRDKAERALLHFLMDSKQFSNKPNVVAS